MLVAPARKLAPEFEFEIPSAFEGPLWRLMQHRPLHLLAARYPDWDALLLESLTAAEALPRQCTSLAACDWGTVNTVHIGHPLSKAVPALASLLDMPPVTAAGGREDMPRVQGPDYGASERFSVSPGREAQGYFHMPGGQSGHPLSPFYRSDFTAWASALPSPYLPGAERHRLVLISD
jgi:penicillin amidase